MKKNTTIAFLKYCRLFLCFFLELFLCISAHASKDVIIIPDAILKAKNANAQKENVSVASTQFTKAAITKSPVVNLSQFLKQEQSVIRFATNFGDLGQEAISIRGFGDNASANTLILIDGFPLINPSLFAPNFNSIPLSDIERIDIFQGSQGSLWGNQAVGGVLAITTKHPQKFFINSLISVGSYYNIYGNFLIGDKKENGFFYKIFGLLGQTDNYRKHNQQKSNNVASTIGMDYERGVISFTAQTYGDVIYSPGGLTEDEFKQNPRQATEFHNYSRYRTNLFQVLNKHALSNQWVLETRLDYHATDSDGFVFNHFNRHEWITSISPRLIGNIDQHKIIVGYDGVISHFEFMYKNAPKRTVAKQNNIYLQTTIPCTDQVDVILGVRKAWQANKIEAVIGNPAYTMDQVFVSEQGIVYHPNQMLSFFARRDGNFSFPKANEETLVPKNVKSLNMQTGTSYETGARWQTENYKGQISIFRLLLNNEIMFNPSMSADQPFGAFNNLDKTLREGISIFQSYYLTPKANINGQFNYVRARFASGLFSGKWIPGVPAINANVALNYHWTEHLAAQYTLLYTGSRYLSFDVENIGKKNSDYWLSDIAIQYFFNEFIFSFEVHNLLDKKYPKVAFFDSFKNRGCFHSAPARNYSLNIKMNIE